MAHQHGRRLHHLLEKPLQLPSPEAVVEATVAAVGRLTGSPETDQIQAVNAPARRGQGAGIAAPVAAASGETMQQHQGRVVALPEHAPVAVMAAPPPGAMGSPLHPRDWGGTGRLRVAPTGRLDPLRHG